MPEIYGLLSGLVKSALTWFLMNMNFRHGNWRNSSTIDMIKRYIRSMDADKRKSFCSLQLVVPVYLGGLGQHMKMRTRPWEELLLHGFPEVSSTRGIHASSYRSPEYMDYELLEKSFNTAIDGYAQTFDLL